jgi:hypothetical protein
VVVAEVALSFVLLIGSGLMVRSFIALQRVDAGYDASNVLTFVLQAPQRQDEERTAFLRQVTERLRAIPGVLGVTAATPLPLDGGSQNVPWSTEAGASDPSAFRQANFHNVRPGYFEDAPDELLAGRTFTDEDNVAGTTKVIVDDMLAARAFPGATRWDARCWCGTCARMGPMPAERARRSDWRRCASASRVAGRARTRSDFLRRKLLRPWRRRAVGHSNVGTA